MFKFSVFNEPVISLCVSKTVFYSSGSIGGFVTGVLGIEERADICTDISRCCM
jgi:hypothetical protein